MLSIPMSVSDVMSRAAAPAAPGLLNPITLPNHLRGYVKYVVVLNPLDSKTYSLGIKYVCETDGAREVLQRLSDKRERKHRKPLQAGLCLAMVQGNICPMAHECPAIHCTWEGLLAMRPWSQQPPPKAPHPNHQPTERAASGSLSPTSSVGDRSPSSMTLSDGDASDVSAPCEARLSQIALWVDAAGDDDLKPLGPARSAGDSPLLIPALRLDPAQFALRQSLIRLRQRVQHLEANPPTHEPDAGAPCARVYCQLNLSGAVRPSTCWADDVDDETISDEAAE